MICFYLQSQNNVKKAPKSQELDIKDALFMTDMVRKLGSQVFDNLLNSN